MSKIIDLEQTLPMDSKQNLVSCIESPSIIRNSVPFIKEKTHNYPSRKRNDSSKTIKNDNNPPIRSKSSSSKKKRKRQQTTVTNNDKVKKSNNMKERKISPKKLSIKKEKLPKVISTGLGNIVGASSTQEVIETPTEAYWEIEKIVGRRVTSKGVQYLVRWKGCLEDQNTWEPVENLCDTAYRDALQFHKEEKLREKKRFDDELRLGLYGNLKEIDNSNLGSKSEKPNDNKSKIDLEMDANIEVGEEEDDKWEWNDKEQLQFKPLERIDVNTKNASEKITEHRLNGIPFVLIGHKGWAGFATRWLKKRKSNLTFKSQNLKIAMLETKGDNESKIRKDNHLEPLDIEPKNLDLSDPLLTLDVQAMLDDIGREDVPVVRRNYNEHSPINGVIPVSKFLKVCWTESTNKDGESSKSTVSSSSGAKPISSRIYLHQWQFPLSDTAGRKLGKQNAPLETVLGEDLLCHWLDLPQCIGDNPFQYIFMGREDTHSKLHCDNGGLAITIAPIVGHKECTLVHRMDGMSCLYHLNASVDNPDLNEYPLASTARIWRSVIEPGEILFMPAGTFHQCHNVTPCLSYSRFHLDHVNLIPFLRSFYDGDAKEIVHDEILWNACIGLMRKVEKIADEAATGKGRPVTKLEYQTVTTLRKLRNIVKDITRKLSVRDEMKGHIKNEQGCHDWFQLVNDLDLCLHEFRYRKYTSGAPKFKPIFKKEDLLNVASSTKGNGKVVAFDTELETAFLSLKYAPKISDPIDLSTIQVGDMIQVNLCNKSAKAKVLELLKSAKIAYLSYEDYPSIYDEWQFYENLRSVKGDGAELLETDVKEGVIVSNRWGDSKSDYRAKVQKTFEGAILRVRFIGMGSEVVERLITPNMIINKLPVTFESAPVEKQKIKEIVVPVISDNSSENEIEEEKSKSMKS